MLSLALALPLLLSPQGGGWEQAPVGLTVVCVDVGHGDSTVILAPDGTLHVIDAGLQNQGTLAVNPAILAMKPTGYGFAVATHYDFCHIGGLDEVISRFPFQEVYDRGDEASPTSSSTFDAYVAAAGARRRTAVEGQVLQLGGGATLTVLAVNGRVMGGTVVPVAGTAREENGRSVAMRLDYGSFSMWIGGDLHGGAGGTADVETPASLVCGDIDVYQVDHHGSELSTSVALVNQLRPELAVFSAGRNSRGSPTPQVIRRLNMPSRTAVLMGTTVGEGAVGFAVTGTVVINTDGMRYRATAATGDFVDFFVDEIAGHVPSAADLCISELHRDSAQVPDASGEYFELTNVGAAPVSLREMQVVNTSGSYRFTSSIMLVPGRPLILQSDGASIRNGGLPLGVVWPVNSIVLDDTADTLSVVKGGAALDAVVYSAGFPGGPGVAAERMDLGAGAAASNFAAAVIPYGMGDLGTPGARNSVDISALPANIGAETEGNAIVFHATALSHGGLPSAIGLSFGSVPGFAFLGAQIPLNIDLLLLTTLPLPGFVTPLPTEGYRSLRLPIPGGWTGAQWFTAHFVVDVAAETIPTVSPALPVVLP